MVDFGATAQTLFGQSSFFGNGLTIFIFFIIIAGLCGVIAFFLIMHLRYKYRIEIYENLSGQGYVRTYVDKAMIVKLGGAGAEVLWLRKRREFVQAYGKKSGKNTFWFAKGKDGYLRNISLGNLDHNLKDQNVEFVDRDMRYMHVAIQRNTRDRFDEKGFWSKYGGLVAYMGLIAITGIMMYLLFDKWLDISSGLNTAIESATKVVESSERLLGAVDAVQGSGGLTPAPV